MSSIETSRVPKKEESENVIVIETRPDSIVGDDESTIDFFVEGEFPEFVPKLGILGAPMCRLTTSVITLIGMMIGLVMGTTGACIVVFFTQEPTIIPLGVTLLSIGGILVFIGLIMWMSEFMFDDCLGRAYHKIRKAPYKNAIKRREKLASRATTRTGSRLSQASLRTASTTVSQRF
uniref:Uncharacterized protein n=1 Tax=Panagrolaimus sp. JU765 TaxID=591449 RepID=A0AC34RBD6_9BILA